MARGANEASDDRLKLLVERIERLNGEKQDLSTDIAAVFAEAKATGYDVAILREVIKIRKQDRAEREEKEAVLEL
mgnify:CR=1 FL=1